MLPLFYAALLSGAGMLFADIAGRFRAEAPRVRWWRAIGGVAAAAVGLAPLILMIREPGAWSWPYPVFVAGYAAAGALYVLGLLDAAGRRSVVARRAGYVALLLLGAVPSWVLIFLAPAIGLAGIGLVQTTMQPKEG